MGPGISCPVRQSFAYLFSFQQARSRHYDFLIELDKTEIKGRDLCKKRKEEKEEIMSEEITVSKTMDLKGLPCPQPVIKVSKGIKEIEVGQVLEAVTTDPGALSDFPAWARTSGNEILKTDQESGLVRFYIRRVK